MTAPAPTSNESFAKVGIDMLLAVEGMSSSILATTTEQLKLDQQNQQRLAQEKQQLIQRETEAAQTQKKWEQLSTGLEYVGYITMFVTASNVVGVAGYALQALAAAGLVNRFFTDTGLSESLLHNFVQSRQTQEQIQTTMRVIGVASSLGALFLVWQVGPVVQLPSPAELVTSMERLGFITSVAGKAAEIGGKWSERRRLFIQADTKQIETFMQIGAKEFQERMQSVERGNKSLQGAIRSSKNILANAEVHSQE